MKSFNRVLCALLSLLITFSFVFSDLVKASDLEGWDPEYIIIEEDDENLCYEEVPLDPPSQPIEPAEPTEPTEPSNPGTLVPTVPTFPGIPLDPVKPPPQTMSITVESTIEYLPLEDGCEYQEVYIDFVEYTSLIPYEGSSSEYLAVVYDDVVGYTPQFWPFLIPVFAPVVTRYAGKIVVKQFLKNTTKNIVIRNGHLAGKIHPVSGVKFSAQGFPMFVEKYAMTLPTRLLKSSNSTQFYHANKALKEGINKSSTLRSKFTSSQLTDIRNGKTPRNLTWHHHETRGRMELVDTKKHNQTGHTGGKSIWGSN